MSLVRAYENINSCIFIGCPNTDLLLIPNMVRVRMLCDLNFFIPGNTRVCADHLSADNWEDLMEAPLCDEFSPAHTQEIVNVMRQALIVIHSTVSNVLGAPCYN